MEAINKVKTRQDYLNTGMLALLVALVLLGSFGARTASSLGPAHDVIKGGATLQEGQPSTLLRGSNANLPAYPLKLSANHRYLVDQNNTPFLIVADSPQGLIGHLSEAQADSYFANRQAHGFNTAGWIDTACAGNDYRDNPEGATPDGIRPFTGFVAGGTDYTHYDLTKPNAVYFTRLDHIITLAAKHGIFVFIDPIETIGWLKTLRNNGLPARLRLWTVSRTALQEFSQPRMAERQ
jgi:hypothetical protein